MRFEQALDLQRGDVVAFIGAGGKTSALFQLGRELHARGWRVLATTTTRIAFQELAGAPGVLHVDGQAPDYRLVTETLDEKGFVFLYDQHHGSKVRGVAPHAVRYLLDRAASDILLIEADGSRMLPFKAPYPHEPVIPRETTRIILSAGMDALGQPLDSDHVYNAEAMIHRYGYPMGKPIVWPWMASVLKDEQLGLANLPPGVPVTVLLNKTPATGSIRRRAQLIASLLLRSSRIDAVVIGEMQAFRDPVHEVRRPVAAVVLAAGKSSRMGGRSKVLLPWGKQTVLETIIRQLFMCRLDRVVIVTGRDAAEVRRVAAPYDLEVVHNSDYETGEMLSSLQVGLNALGQRYDSALVVLGDQPQMQAHVVSRILDAYAEGEGGIIIPSFQMRRGHPVLFSRAHWPALQGLPPGSAPRDVVNANVGDIGYVEVNTETILQDIDTPEQYRSALRKMGLA